jgi:hypothetical protein
MPDLTNAAGAIGTSGLGAALPFVGAGIGALQAGIGIVQQAKAQKKINGLLDQRTAFQTSGQVYDIVNATLNNSQGDTITRDYETNQIGQNLSNTLGTATRLGADPNTLSSLFGQSVSGVMQAGQQFHASNTAAFSNVLSAFKLLSDNKDAEYASGQDIIKDKLAAAGAKLATSTQNISGGINTALGSLTSKATGDLFKNNNSTTSLSDMLNASLGISSSQPNTFISNELANRNASMVNSSQILSGTIPKLGN